MFIRNLFDLRPDFSSSHSLSVNSECGMRCTDHLRQIQDTQRPLSSSSEASTFVAKEEEEVASSIV